MIVWIIGGIGLLMALVGFILSQSHKSGRSGQVLKSCGLVLVAGACVWQSIRSWQPENNLVIDRGQAALGYVMAQHLSGDLQKREGAVLLVMPQDGVADASSLDGFYESFARVLLRIPTLKVSEATLKTSRTEMGDGSFSADELRKTLSQHQDPAAIILWTGYPSESGTQGILRGFSENKTTIYACDFFDTGHWKTGMENETLTKAFVLLPGVDMEKVPDGSPPETIFKALYKVEK